MGTLWFAAPFLLSSNLLLPVGLTKGERVVYLPSLGWCMIIAANLPLRTTAIASTPAKGHGKKVSWRNVFVVVLALSAYARKLTERAHEWSSSLDVWESAYKVGKARGCVGLPYTKHSVHGVFLCQK